jgi:hypothetical protein
LHHHAWPSFYDGDWRNPAVCRKDLRHTDFSSDDSVDHVSISDCLLPIADSNSIRQHSHSGEANAYSQKPIGNRQLEIGNAVIAVRKL